MTKIWGFWLNPFGKLVYAGIFSIIMLLLLFLLSVRLFYSVEVKLELKSSHPDRCQIFYRSIGGFNEGNSLIKHYSSEGGFSTLVFNLPNQFISELRIDPGFHSQFYEINKIEISAGKDTICWEGAAILNGFIEVNLKSDSLGHQSYLHFKTGINPDAQLLLQKPLFLLINFINAPAAIILLSLIALIWIAGLIIIYLFSPQQITSFSISNYCMVKAWLLGGFKKFEIKAKSFFLKNNTLELTFSHLMSFSKSWWMFAIFLALLVLDRTITLFYFGFVYTDIDQTVMWNGAFDYSMGIFHEPFFYGQNYNFMIEALLAGPLLWINVPVYMALPLVTSFISILPFIVLAFCLRKKKKYFWAYLSLILPVFLPLQYNFLTTISRVFVGSHLFFPLLLIPLFLPTKARSVNILYISSALCFITNPSSSIIILPIFLYVYAHHYKSRSFYTRSFWLAPFFLLYFMAKYYYVIHPERAIASISGIYPTIDTFFRNLNNPNLFDNLFPFVSNWGRIYPILLAFLLIITLFEKKHKEALFIFSGLLFLVFTLAIPKVFVVYTDAGIFYTPSRFYIYVPILVFLSLYIVLKHLKIMAFSVYLLLLVSIISFAAKNRNIQQVVEHTISETVFPVAKNSELLKRSNELKQIAEQYDVDLIVNNEVYWNYVFDSYTFNPLTHSGNHNNKSIISVNLRGDRRTWIYRDTSIFNHILLNGVEIGKEHLNTLDYEILNNNLIFINNNDLGINDLFKKLRSKPENSE